MLFHQSRNKTIYWKLHAAGLINQMMSVETGAGISFMEKTPICFYKTKIDNNRTIHPSGVIPEKRKKLYAGVYGSVVIYFCFIKTYWCFFHK